MKIKSQKGSIVLYTLIAMLIFSAIAVGYFIRSTNKQQIQTEAIDQLKNIYATNETV